MAAVGNVFFWDDEKEAKLVELWQKNDCLYETTSEGYEDRGKKNQVYVEIADALETTGMLCAI